MKFAWNLADFQVKSTQNLVKAGVSTKTIQFDACRRGAMTPDFMKSGVIAPSMHPPNWRVFVETSDLIRLWVDFMKSARFHGFHEIHQISRISKLWAFAWWSSNRSFDFRKTNKGNCHWWLAQEKYWCQTSTVSSQSSGFWYWTDIEMTLAVFCLV